jgi:hypothetical protein
MISAFEQAKTVHALNRAATVTSYRVNYMNLMASHITVKWLALLCIQEIPSSNLSLEDSYPE